MTSKNSLYKSKIINKKEILKKKIKENSENICTLAVLLILLSVFTYFLFFSPEVKQLEKDCLLRGFEDECNIYSINCYDDCNSLNMGYFKLLKLNGGLFARDEISCLCKIGNESKQIW